MLSLPTRRGPRTAALLLAAGAGALLATAQTASAADHCVGVTPGCTGASYAFTAAGLASAVAAASAGVDADRIVIAPGTIAAITGISVNSPGPLEIAGAGRDKTVISWSGAVSVGMNLGGTAPTTLHDLGFTIGGVTTPQPRAVVANGPATTLTRVDLRETSSVDNAVILSLGSGATLVDGAVVANSPGDASVVMHSATGDILHSTIDAGGGVGVSTSSTGQHLIARSRISNAYMGVAADAGAVTVRDSVFDLGAVAGRHGIFMGNHNAGQKPISLTALRNTIVGTGSKQAGITVMADSPLEVASGSVTDTVASLTGVGSADLSCVQGGGGKATLGISTSMYAELAATGTCVPTSTGWIDAAATPPGFVDRADGDLRPAVGSPLVDAGSSSADAAGLDLSGGARLTDGDGDGAAKVDVGSLESAPTLPVAPAGNGGTEGGGGSTPDDGAKPVDVSGQGDGGPVVPNPTPTPESSQPTPQPTATPVPTPTPQARLPKAVVVDTAKVASKRGKAGFAIARKATARTFSVRFADTTSVELTLAKVGKGRLVAGNGPSRCLAGQGTPSCRRITPVAGQAVIAVDGTTTVAIGFGGRWAGRTVKAGTYRVTVTPIAGARRGAPVTTTIHVA